mmetsp:Transcript_3534/g.4585  ORF Transcript_3534/g.4585 Transcript_3534/m.4585 type:complete len:99 (-) Transcript_3534:71-367(-)
MSSSNKRYYYGFEEDEYVFEEDRHLLNNPSAIPLSVSDLGTSSPQFAGRVFQISFQVLFAPTCLAPTYIAPTCFKLCHIFTFLMSLPLFLFVMFARNG